MPISDTEGNPQTGDAQEIGQDAEDAFRGGRPRSWIIKGLDGTDDYGLDFQIQLKADHQILDIFRVQLKGTRSPTRSAGGEFISIALSASTLRYYSRIVEPVLLVLCDLSVDPENPTVCPLYYVWLRQELRRVEVESVPFAQQTVTLRVPTTNVLQRTTDLLPEIRLANALAEVGHALDVRVSELRPNLGLAERVGLVQDVGRGISSRSSALVDALAEPTEKAWPEPARGTLAWSLRAIAAFLRDGRADRCAAEVDRANALLTEAPAVERAELFYLSGRVCAMRGDDVGASANYKNAQEAQPLPKYLAAWGESELRARFEIDGERDYSDLIAAMVGTDPLVLGMKARLLAASKRQNEALELLGTFEGQEKLAALAVVQTMSGKPAEACQACLDGLALAEVTDSCRQLFTVLKARARFSIAVGYGTSVHVDQILPPSGLADVNLPQIKDAWPDIVAAVDVLEESGWATNAEFIADIWAATASMLGKQNEVVDQMLTVARLRPHLEYFQSAVESIAAQCGKFKEALEVNERIPDSDLEALRKTTYLHELGDHRGCVEWFEAHVDKIDHQHQLFGATITMAAQSANILARTDLVAEWRAILQADEVLRPHGPVLDYFLAMEGPNGDREAALSALGAAYEAHGHSMPIAIALFQELDPTDEAQAARCVDVAIRIRESARMPAGAAIHLGMALLTLKKWGDLLELSRDATNQFGDNKRLKAFEGLALEQLDRTDEAREILERMLDGGLADGLALNTYVNIMVRWGFVDEAISAAEQILQGARRDDRKKECIRLLFNLIHTSDPLSPRLFQLAQRMGELVDPNVEEQEGVYLGMILIGTLHGTQAPSPAVLTAFHARCEAFFTKFPDSKILKRLEIGTNASGSDLLRELSRLTGGSDEQRAFQQKLENGLQRGDVVIPFAWRPKHVFPSIRDLFHLWEIAKRSKPDDRQFHLTMISAADWQPASQQKMRLSIPLLDLTSLLVVQDLGLMDKLFAYFPLVGIAKSTIVEIAKLTGAFSGSPWRQKAADLQLAMRRHLSQIRQPSTEAEMAASGAEAENERSLDAASDEVKKIAQGGGYQIYSDDAAFRLYCSGGDDKPQGICTGDLIVALEDSGTLTLAEAAEKFSQLAAWNVGVTLHLKYQIAVIPAELGVARTVKDGVSVLHRSASFMAMANGMWAVRKDYMDGQRHIVAVLLALLVEPSNKPESIASIVGVWFVKAKLRVDSPAAPLDIIVNTFALAAANVARMDNRFSQRLWSAFKALVEFEAGDRMDERREREALEALAKQCARVDASAKLPPESKLRARFLTGLSAGTADHGAFMTAYADELISIGRMVESG
jgi:tetratricopeptide (TPR) repeat protein